MNKKQWGATDARQSRWGLPRRFYVVSECDGHLNPIYKVGGEGRGQGGLTWQLQNYYWKNGQVFSKCKNRLLRKQHYLMT